MKPKIIAILGPTAVGKSELALEIGRAFAGEIINADSQQVYRYMNIGTGKPSPEQRQQVPHHLIDIVNPDDDFDAARFRQLAAAAIESIHSRRKSAIVCGGSGLYIKALTGGLFAGPARDADLRKRLAAEIRAKGLGALYERLKQVDPDATAWIHPNDPQRIVRALEVYELTGTAISAWQRRHEFREHPFEVLKIGLDRERAELYQRIDRRCDRMIDDGLVDEVRGLVAKGYRLQLKSMRSVGYRHIGFFLDGVVTLEEAVALMKRDTRRLAKRQLTWFRADRDIHWFHPQRDAERIRSAVDSFLTQAKTPTIGVGQ